MKCTCSSLLLNNSCNKTFDKLSAHLSFPPVVSYLSTHLNIYRTQQKHSQILALERPTAVASLHPGASCFPYPLATKTARAEEGGGRDTVWAVQETQTALWPQTISYGNLCTTAVSMHWIMYSAITPMSCLTIWWDVYLDVWSLAKTVTLASDLTLNQFPTLWCRRSPNKRNLLRGMCFWNTSPSHFYVTIKLC